MPSREYVGFSEASGAGSPSSVQWINLEQEQRSGEAQEKGEVNDE